MQGKGAARRCLPVFFTLAWLAAFHYEALRFGYLSPLAGKDLPRLPFLYPEAGWMIFSTVSRREPRTEVVAVGPGGEIPIPMESIFRTREGANLRLARAVVLRPCARPSFCAFLARRYPKATGFKVIEGESVDPSRGRRLAYVCP